MTHLMRKDLTQKNSMRASESNSMFLLGIDPHFKNLSWYDIFVSSSNVRQTSKLAIKLKFQIGSLSWEVRFSIVCHFCSYQ